MEEELEVLSVIFDEGDLQSKTDPPGFKIKVVPEEPLTSDPLEVELDLTLTEGYPNEIPLMEIRGRVGELSNEERSLLMEKLLESANESLGDAMVYNIYSVLRQELGQVLSDRQIERKRFEEEELRAAEEKEKSRAKGTPVTKETFLVWRAKFSKEIKLKEIKEQDEKLKALQPKERDELKKALNKLTGRQLFESNRALVNSDASLLEPDAEELDLSAFEKTSEETPPSNPFQEAT
ncbi:hypothetical protein CROQUDRAFT_48976 [Cronartium quercuum f. sp. fusiforme G11]|uniref:RWD domain-containing protein n=1 Tax=Cronartium quercuum f. sp. fusiforme G11 TaxID=708437 RepID=A0A9P6NCC6_9BASI|nr:hypothetical protein CROQUDRAFT_48976 [Cronartium quercuum f. sp. fusiforme G11]